MSDIAVRVEHLSKQYQLGGQQAAYQTFRESLIDTAKAPLRWLKRQRREKNTFWALEDVSFEIKQGEAVGIIGRNGAGKSTLLKILSSITVPTRGRVELFGRVGSLLEVGTGFHPELTGRENIFLNGAILGMTRQEIARKFDEIVDFSEIEKFLDTPVKHYSSGMYVRLAFAVAAHLEPEILLVDEVLAVGDAQFQKKCLGKMGDVAREGKTVLFVSHNMAAIQNLCETAILMDKGKISQLGVTQNIVQGYFQPHNEIEEKDLRYHKRRRLGSSIVLRSLHVFGNGIETTNIPMGGDLRIEVSFENNELLPNIRFGIAIESVMGQRLLAFSPSVQAPNLINAPIRKGLFICNIPNIRLLPGNYFITLIIGKGSSDLDRIDQASIFTIEATDVFGTGISLKTNHGVYYQESKWSFEGE